MPRRSSSLHWGRGIAAALVCLLPQTAMLARDRAPAATCSDKGGEFQIAVNRRMAFVLVDAEVESKSVTLIVDTGSSDTILSTELVKAAAATAKPIPLSTKGSGLFGTGRWIKATMKLGCIVWSDHRFLVMDDLSDISKAAGEKVDGILGEDILKDFAVVEIDFKHGRLLLSR